MLKTFLASTAVAGLLVATSATAQEPPATDIIPAPGEQQMDAPALEMEPAVPPADGMGETFVEDWSPIGIETVSAEELIGSDIRSTMDDAQVATVGDVVLAADGSVDGIVAEFGGFLGFGRSQALIGLDQVEVFRDADGRTMLRTSLTQDALAALPDYEG